MTRHKKAEWHLGAARVAAAVCLVVAVFVLALLAPQDGSRSLSDVHGANAAMPDTTSAPISLVAWSAPDAPSLFGLETEPVAGQVSAKWRTVAAEIEDDLDLLARCRVAHDCPAIAQDLADIAALGAAHDGLARVGLINRAVDMAITPTSDAAQWGVADRWSAPFETLSTRRGDCEDYAILKYAALLAAGVSRDDVKIVILHNVVSDEDHAVAAARIDGAWLILDDSKLALVRDTDMVGALPRFVLDDTGARRFVAASPIQPGPNVSRSATPPRVMRPV